MSAAQGLMMMACMRNAFASDATTTTVRNRRLIVPQPSRLVQQNIFAANNLSSSHVDDSSSSGVGLVTFPVLIALFIIVAVWILWYVRNQHQKETELNALKSHTISRKQSMDLKDRSSCSDDTLSNSSGVDESFELELTKDVVDASNVSVVRNPEVQQSLTDHESERSRRFSYLLDSLHSFGGIDCDDEFYTEVYDDKAMTDGPVGVDDDIEVTTDSFNDEAALTHRSITDSPVADPLLIFNDDEEHLNSSTMAFSRFPYGDNTVQISVVDEYLGQDHTTDLMYDSAHKLLSLLSFSKSTPCDRDNNVVLHPPLVQSHVAPSNPVAQSYKIQKRESRRKRRRSTDASLEQFSDDESDCSSMEELAWMEFQQPTQDDSMKSIEDVMEEWNSNPYQLCGPQVLPAPLSISNPLSSLRQPSAWVPKKVPLHTSTKVEL
jgi:hypothetical protein